MDTSNSLVSVIIPSYQHEQYVGMAIESVLRQSYPNFELIIVDDCSPDDSRKVIEQYKDHRIRFYPLAENIGAVPALNLLFHYAKGEYVALLNSDDYWEPNKLQKQIEFLDEHPDYGMVFSWVRLVTQDSTPEKYTEIPETLFNQENLTQGGWLRKIFFQLNFLCHPSMMIRKELWDESHPYHCAMRQCPDLEMHIYHLKKANLYILPEKLVNLRIMNDSSNASAVTATNYARAETEVMLMMQSFFENMPTDVFLDGFSDLCTIKEEKTPLEIECEQAMMYLQVHNEFSAAYVLVALHKLYDLLNKEQSRNILAEKFNFTYHNFFELTGSKGLHDAVDSWKKKQSFQPVADETSQVSLRKYSFLKFKQQLKTCPKLYSFMKKMLNR